MPYTSIARFVLGPLLLIQGRWVRKTALRIAEAEGDRKGHISFGTDAEPLNLLFVGDSTMAGVGAAHQEAALGALTAREVSALLFRAVRWQIVAKSGVKIGQLLVLSNQEDLLHADVLVIAVGVNDVLAQTQPRAFLSAYEKLIATLMPQDHRGRAIVNGLPPLQITSALPQPLRWFLGAYARMLDRSLRRWTQSSPRISYISLKWATDRRGLAADRFHPGEALYREWAHRIALQIAHSLGAASVPEY
jgi:lysophospholipase L1-like esterase